MNGFATSGFAETKEFVVRTLCVFDTATGCFVQRVDAFFSVDANGYPLTGTPPTLYSIDPLSGAYLPFLIGIGQQIGNCEPDPVMCDCNCA
jgi:hypothetical protein